jgi:hypothetical protein
VGFRALPFPGALRRLGLLAGALAAVVRLRAGAFVARGLVAALRGAAFAVVRRAGAGFAAARRVAAWRVAGFVAVRRVAGLAAAFRVVAVRVDFARVAGFAAVRDAALRVLAALRAVAPVAARRVVAFVAAVLVEGFALAALRDVVRFAVAGAALRVTVVLLAAARFAGALRAAVPVVLVVPVRFAGAFRLAEVARVLAAAELRAVEAAVFFAAGWAAGLRAPVVPRLLVDAGAATLRRVAVLALRVVAPRFAAGFTASRAFAVLRATSAGWRENCLPSAVSRRLRAVLRAYSESLSVSRALRGR